MECCEFVVTGGYSDSSIALDMAQLLGVPFDVADMVSLKSFANSEFCPRFIPDNRAKGTGKGLTGKTVIICSASHFTLPRNELAMRNLILARAAKENNAARVILVEPDLFYSAQDRGPYRFGELEADRSDQDLYKFDGQPFTSHLYAELLKTAGVDTVITVHNHSKKVQHLFKVLFQGGFYNLVPSDLYAHYIHNSDFVRPGKEGENLILCAPDKGARPMIDLVWDELKFAKARRITMDKVRSGERQVSMELASDSECGLDDLKGRDVIIFDDMVRTGSTIIECCRKLRLGNPRRICFCVTHFLPSEEARENLNSKDLDEILTTATIPSVLNRDVQGRLRRKIAVLKIGKWISRFIIEQLHCGEASALGDEFYSVDMSSKNPRWATTHFALRG